MDGERPKALIAAPAAIIRELGSALTEGVDVIGAQTFSEAVRELEEGQVDALILCYAFDELRPFRLLHYLYDERAAHIPTILVRALPVPLGSSHEVEIRETYRMLGADEFINLHGEAARIGRAAAVDKFRDAVFRLLRVAT